MSPPVGLVRVAHPPGHRSAGGGGVAGSKSEWMYARDARGSTPWWDDLNNLHRRFPSDHSRASFLAIVKERMELAQLGQAESEWVVQMQCAPDVLELKFPDWTFVGGAMMTRLYFAEPIATPGHLVALRLRLKRPGPIGVEEQTKQALDASQLLWEFSEQGYPSSPT